jgi:hypothetical protein
VERSREEKGRGNAGEVVGGEAMGRGPPGGHGDRCGWCGWLLAARVRCEKISCNNWCVMLMDCCVRCRGEWLT